MDADGNKIWIKSTTGNAHPWTMLNNPDGSGILCAGQIFGFSALSFGSTTVNPINGNSFITKIDYNGVFQNSFAFASGPGSYAKSLATNSQGVFYVGGMSSSSPPTFSCIAREGRAGLYLGKFTEQPDKAPTPSITVSGNTLTATPAFTGTIQWFLNGNAISGANSQTLTIPQNGNYTVTYVLPNYTACVSTSTNTTISALATNDFESLNNALTVYPNPSSGLFYVKGFLETAILSKVEVKNSLGQSLISVTNFDSNQALNLTNYANGMYFIQITNENKTATFKVLKQ